MRFSFVLAVILLILGGSHLYLARRFWHILSHFFPKLPFGVLIGLFAVLLLVLTMGFSRSMLSLPATVKQALGVANACWMGVFLYLLMFFLLTDIAYLLVRLFYPTERFWFLAAGLILALAVSGYGFYHATDLQLKEYDVTVPGAEDLTIVLISDVHLGAVGSETKLPNIVENINALEPDVVCIAGDVFDSDFAAIRDPDTAAETLKSLSATYGTWAVLGNHDAGSTATQMQAYLARCNIGVLKDEYTVLGNKLVLAGRLDGSPIGGYNGQKRQPLNLDGVDPALPVVVMDHNPAHIGEYGEEIDLILSGHTHKGQIFPGSLITNWMYTVDYGYYRANGTAPQVIVSSGVGAWGMPMRVGTDCEIVKIALHS